MKNLLEFLLIHIVNHPEDVAVEEVLGENEDLYLISVHAEDVGRVIGKSGNVIQAIRSIAKVRAMKEHRKIRITLKEE